MKAIQPLNIYRLLVITGGLLAAGQLRAQLTGVTGGNLYVFQAGDGVTAANSGVAAPAFIDQFTTSAHSGNGYTAQTALPTTPASAGGSFLSQGQGQQDGQISYNPATGSLVFGGYSGMAINSSLNTSPVANRDAIEIPLRFFPRQTAAAS